MTLFWISAAGLMVLAMAFIVLPLLRKREYETLSSDELNLTVFKQQLEELDDDLKAGILDQDRYDAARKDLEKELLLDVDGNQTQPAPGSVRSGRWIMSVSLVVPLLALLMYQMLGTPEIIERLAADPTNPSAHPQQSTEKLPPMEELVRKLASKMEEQPDNIEGWVMLGRSYMAIEQPTEAIQAYERAMQLNADKPSLLLAYAEALAKMDNRNFTGKAANLIEKAYQLDNQNPNGLWMMGIVSYQRDNYADAIGYWEQVKTLLDPQSEDLEAIDSALADARAQLGMEPELPPITQAGKPAPAEPTAENISAIQVKVTLSPELRSKVKPTDTVFVYAKALSGPPMPLAASRKTAQDLPLNITLDDSMAMMPQLKLSAFSEIVVGARISLTGGGPGAQSGDLEGEIKPVKPGQTEPVLVTIDSIHP